MNNGNDSTADLKLPPTLLGWIVRLVSLACLALLIGVLLWEISRPAKNIRFDVKLVTDNAYVANDRHFVPVEISNKGSATARAVDLDVTVNGATRTLEIDMIGQNETVSYTVASDQPIYSIEYELVSYEGG